MPSNTGTSWAPLGAGKEKKEAEPMEVARDERQSAGCEQVEPPSDMDMNLYNMMQNALAHLNEEKKKAPTTDMSLKETSNEESTHVIPEQPAVEEAAKPQLNSKIFMNLSKSEREAIILRAEGDDKLKLRLVCRHFKSFVDKNERFMRRVGGRLFEIHLDGYKLMALGDENCYGMDSRLITVFNVRSQTEHDCLVWYRRQEKNHEFGEYEEKRSAWSVVLYIVYQILKRAEVKTLELTPKFKPEMMTEFLRSLLGEDVAPSARKDCARQEIRHLKWNVAFGFDENKIVELIQKLNIRCLELSSFGRLEFEGFFKSLITRSLHELIMVGDSLCDKMSDDFLLNSHFSILKVNALPRPWSEVNEKGGVSFHGLKKWLVEFVNGKRDEALMLAFIRNNQIDFNFDFTSFLGLCALDSELNFSNGILTSPSGRRMKARLVNSCAIFMQF